MNNFIADLHIHTLYSDGEYPPDAIIRRVDEFIKYFREMGE